MKAHEMKQPIGNRRVRVEPQKEIVEGIIGKLSAPMCLAPEEFYWDLGTRCLTDWEQLPAYYQNDLEKLAIVNDLKERLEKLKNNELPRHNRELAKFISKELLR